MEHTAADFTNVFRSLSNTLAYPGGSNCPEAVKDRGMLTIYNRLSAWTLAV